MISPKFFNGGKVKLVAIGDNDMKKRQRILARAANALKSRQNSKDKLTSETLSPIMKLHETLNTASSLDSPTSESIKGAKERRSCFKKFVDDPLKK